MLTRLGFFFPNFCKKKSPSFPTTGPYFPALTSRMYSFPSNVCTTTAISSPSSNLFSNSIPTVSHPMPSSLFPNSRSSSFISPLSSITLTQPLLPSKQEFYIQKAKLVKKSFFLFILLAFIIICRYENLKLNLW